MAKQKSSASSATRKKHARKAAGTTGEPLAPVTEQKKVKGSKKDKHAPKIKQYIPPSKPAPLRPDPLDVGGLAARIDPELLVVLRRLGKKDAVTKRRALEELTQLAASDPDGLADAAPVWAHHFPALALHPARRVRALTASTHAALLPMLLSDNVAIDLVPLLGPWCMLAHDVDRAVAIAARPAWDAHGASLFARGDYERETLDEFIARAAMDPAAVYAELNPSPPAPPPAPAKRGIASTSAIASPELRDKVEGEEEAPADRAARLRVGALGALGWLIATANQRPGVLHAPDLWTSLSAAEGAFGRDQPGLRRAAWTLVGVLSPRGLEGDELVAVAAGVLRSAWVEPDPGVRAAMWEPLLVFLTKFPKAWHINRDHDHEQHDDHDEEESDDEDHEHEDAPAKKESRAYAEFLQFLALGCGGSPARGYHTVLVVLSTIPPDILSDGSAFFASLWGAVDGRALSTPDASRAFLSALVECALFFASHKYGGDAPAQLARAWEALIKKELRNVPATTLADGLSKLAKLDPDALNAAWGSIAEKTKTELQSEGADRAHVVHMLKDLRTRPELGSLVVELARAALQRRDDGSLVGLLDAFGEQLMGDSEFCTELDAVVAQTEPPPSIALLLVYLAHRPDQQLWYRILVRADVSTLEQLLSALHSRPSLRTLRPQGNELDALFESILSDVLSGTSSPDIASKLLASPEPFLSSTALIAAEQRLANSVSMTADAVLRDPSIDLTAARAALSLVSASGARAWGGVRPKAFVLSRLVPGALPDVAVALRGEDERDAVLHDLHNLLLDVSVLATPAQILDTALRAMDDKDPRRVLNLLFPPEGDMERMRAEAARVPFSAGHAVVEPLAGSAPAHASSSKRTVDAHGRTAYERVLDALVQFFSAERSLAREDLWIVAHIALLPASPEVDALAAYLLVPPDDGWHVRVADAITKPAASVELDALGESVSGLVRKCSTPREAVGLGRVLKRLVNGAEVADAEAWMRAARSLERSTPLASHAILRIISSTSLEPPLLARYRTELAATLAGVPPAKCNTEGLRLLRALNAAAPDVRGDVALVPQQRAVFLMKAVERWIEEADELEEEVESELAELFAGLAPVLQSVPGRHWEVVLDLVENGLEGADINDDDGLLTLARTLRLLSTVIELVASTKMLRQDYWVAREKKIMELVLRLLESEANSDRDSAPRAACKELLVNLAAHIPSTALDQDTLGKTVHLLSSSNPAVLQASYPFLQRAAAKRTEYLVIESAATSLTVEATAAEDGEPVPVDEPAVPKIALPDELLALLQLRLDVELDDVESAESLALLPAWQGMLFAWMLLFDSFVDASAKIKAGFVEQLRELDLIETFFAPNILGLLNVTQTAGSGAARKPYKLDAWVVDEFYLSFYDPTSTLSPRLLAAHLFFRALDNAPSLVRAWFLKSKDRQLHTAVTAYIAAYFSPPLIASALQPLRALSADSELKADGWSLRIGGGTEALLAYTVDEQSLEIALRLPGEWPLKGAEAREVRRVGGIPENKWRAWVFGLQQVAGGAGVLEGLLHFRKNVAGHFAGQVECAICYCIISVTDQSLPTKPCRTCKNRFHASCLYKWFKSSHASTCPLCRSDIL